MKIYRPKAILCLFLLAILLPTLPSCSGTEPGDPATTTTEPSDSAVAIADELLGSWMLLSGDGMEIYTFRRGGEVTIYEMESATVVGNRYSGSYSLTGDRLTIEIGGSTEVYTALTDNGRALILDGQILTPVAEPEG